MTWFPSYVELEYFREIAPDFPFHISVNRIPRHFPAHRHDFLELSFVMDGQGVEIVNGMPHPLAPGTATFLLPYQTHEIHAAGDGLTLINCMFGLELLPLGEPGGVPMLGELLQEPGRTAPSGRTDMPSHVQLDESDRLRFQGILDDLLEEYRLRRQGREALIRIRLMEALARFQRLRLSLQAESAGSSRPQAAVSAKSTLAWEALVHMHRNHQDTLSLTMLADRYGVSDSYLGELLKRLTGKAFVELMHEIRLRHACALLVSTDLPVTDIAFRVGYGSLQTFHRAFRSRKGESPAAFRRKRMP